MELGVAVSFAQSNHEGDLVDLIQGLRGKADGAIVNLGAYTHTSLAIRDAFLAAPIQNALQELCASFVAAIFFTSEFSFSGNESAFARGFKHAGAVALQRGLYPP